MCNPNTYYKSSNLNARTSNLLISLNSQASMAAEEMGLCGADPVYKKGYVNHHYKDYSSYPIDMSKMGYSTGGSNFPIKLYKILDDAETEGFTDIISWQPHGRAFRIHHPQRFSSEILPRYFGNIRFSSFLRQVNLYGFLRLYQKTDDHDSYYQELFLRGRLDLVKMIRRECVKGHGVRQSACINREPRLYSYAPVGSFPLNEMNMTCMTPELPPSLVMDVEPLPLNCPSLVPLPELASFLQGCLFSDRRSSIRGNQSMNALSTAQRANPYSTFQSEGSFNHVYSI